MGARDALDFWCPQWRPFSVGRVPGSGNSCGAISFLTPLFYSIVWYLSTKCGRILCEQQGKIPTMEVNVERLRELRQEQVLSLRELEERSGVSYNTIWRIEAGRQGAQPRTIRKLAEALEVDPKELIRRES